MDVSVEELLSLEEEEEVVDVSVLEVEPAEKTCQLVHMYVVMQVHSNTGIHTLYISLWWSPYLYSLDVSLVVLEVDVVVEVLGRSVGVGSIVGDSHVIPCGRN